MSEDNEIIELNLDDDVYNRLLEVYVNQSLSKESIGVYCDYINDGCSVKDALSHAIANEMVNRVLTAEIERQQLANALNNNKEESNNDNDKNSR